MNATLDRSSASRVDADEEAASYVVEDMSSATEDVESYRDEKEQVVIATSENKRVGYMRVILMLVLAAVAAFISCGFYFGSKEGEQIGFENYAREACEKVATSFQSSATSRLTAIASLAEGIASNAAARGEHWPNVTVPDFEERVSLTLDLADVMSITMLPVVTGENLDGWGEYSVKNAGWYHESLEFQRESGTNHSQWSEDVEALKEVLGEVQSNTTIHPGIYSFFDNSTFYDALADEGPFLPWWQFAPVFPVPSILNYDTATNPSRQYQIRAVLENKSPLVSEAWDYSDTENPHIIGKQATLNLYLKRWEDGGKSYQKGPVSDLYYPVFDRDSSDKQTVAAILTAYIYWQVYFEDVLSSSSEPVMAVLENVCGSQAHHEHQRSMREDDHHQHRQQFTYKIIGEKAEYMGPGDHHDDSYDYLEESTGWHAFLAGTNDKDHLMEGQCLYQVRIYPTKEMEDNLTTNDPVYNMLFVLATFLITSLVFCVYDCFVERRQKAVMTKAIKSTKVVQEMFPENVRERLFEESTGDTSSSQQHQAGAKQRLRDSSCATNNRSSLESLDDQLSRPRGPMVADLYPNCTVLFADIAGFTQWSSNREPRHVFQLLETLYGAFDRLAKQRKVFKVETIGDCYLGITGVPRPRRDHAVAMTKFAAACMEKMDFLVQNQLKDALGEETSLLQLRAGIHSGSVTAGVLRGERARYQIFGDTVNTASRMESNSLPGKIQVSSETAELLKAANKGSWLAARPGGIEAKGKGTLATFWVLPNRPSSSMSGSVSSAGLSGESEPTLTEDTTGAKDFIDGSWL
ncbi:Receptor-type guanylate cyclase gcy [Seminavis robusta]|uniref:Receptor-type guanylate cyclase gcy n=1 Tax=Seminavis robusta TaxID=568900 RepID=A0A9N8EM29_9STRA|nr:Receptor-type guanylate cyclase gcy [Seminavis robusta]|eukprot:Sro1447_g273590.1 Receptor-type guanylate cyclase gcy (805) ;mRNA; r:20872-23550